MAAAWDGATRAIFVVAGTVTPTSVAAVAELERLGLRPVLLTGDDAHTAHAVAAEIGIDDVIAEVLPADKAAVVRRLHEERRTVAMVGDGINDAPALAEADLGLAIGTGTDVAIEASDITLVSGNLHAAADAIRLARRTLPTIKGNLFWAFAYNVAALPLVTSATRVFPTKRGTAFAPVAENILASLASEFADVLGATRVVIAARAGNDRRANSSVNHPLPDE